MSRLLALALAVLLAGCTTVGEDLDGVDSVTRAGVTSFRQNEEVRADGSATKYVEATFGKEYGEFTLSMGVDVETGKVLSIDVSASEVSAFEGQKIAADAVVEIRKELAARDIAIAEAAYPVIADIIARIIVPTP